METSFNQRTWILSHCQDTNSMKIPRDTNKTVTSQTSGLFFGANYIAKEYEQPNHHQRALSDPHIQASEGDTLTEIKNCLKRLSEISKQFIVVY